MQSLFFYYSKFVQKYLRGKCIANSKIDKTACINSGSSVYDSKIGRYSYLGYDCVIINAEIGSFCSFASGIHLGLAEHPMYWVSTSPVFQNVANSSIKKRFAKIDLPKGKRTYIGHDVWIGTNAIIKAGVSIGTGSIVASGAVVTKDVEPYTVVGGVPAKVIKYRFEKQIIAELLESEWWTWPDEKIHEFAHLIYCPEEFLSRVHYR